MGTVGRGGDEFDTTVVTDDDGEAVFELDAPRRGERLDTVTFIPDCADCANRTYKFAWSTDPPILSTVQPDFEPPSVQTQQHTLILGPVSTV